MPTSTARAETIAPSQPRANHNIARLIAAVVPGRVDFTADGVANPSAPESLPMYQRPADKHAAATAVNAGRLIDLRG
ncbi:MAG: hypothetical protein ACKVZJ_08980 [Phycisphaerales bacterium]